MKWIAREKVKVDRGACPWLVRRFIDPGALFEFLPKETGWSRVTGGIVFDAYRNGTLPAAAPGIGVHVMLVLE